jgi:hypothetical protein
MESIHMAQGMDQWRAPVSMIYGTDRRHEYNAYCTQFYVLKYIYANNKYVCQYIQPTKTATFYKGQNFSLVKKGAPRLTDIIIQYVD